MYLRLKTLYVNNGQSSWLAAPPPGTLGIKAFSKKYLLGVLTMLNWMAISKCWSGYFGEKMSVEGSLGAT